MINKYYLPSITKFSNFLIESIKNKKDVGIEAKYEKETISTISSSLDKIYTLKCELESNLAKSKNIAKIENLSFFLKDNVLGKMDEIRDIVDSLELIVGKEYWPFISYGDLLYSVK